MTAISPARAEWAAAGLASVHAALLVYAAATHSPSIDEVGHMSAGLSHWQFRRFDRYRVNPPLVRLVATAPVALLRPKANLESSSHASGSRPEFDCGEQFIGANGQRSFLLFAVARCACIPFSLLGAYVCYHWARRLYGAAGGLLAMTLWCFSPNILAHGQMITPDVGATALGAAACYLFWRWLRRASWPRALVVGLALGVAELTKTTLLIFYAVWPVAWLACWLSARMGQAREIDRVLRDGGSHHAKTSHVHQALQLAFMLVLSIYVVNLGYAFEGPLKRLGDFRFVSLALGGARDVLGPKAGHNRFSGRAVGVLPVPLPASYVLGIDQQKNDFERGLSSYLRGEWRRRGWWYYYIYGLAIKVPVGTWGLLLLAVVTRLAEPRKSGRATGETVTWRDELVLLIPVLAILTLVSSQTGFNRHLRYLLPIFPFVFVWIGRLGPSLGVRRFTAYEHFSDSVQAANKGTVAGSRGAMTAACEAAKGSPHSMVVTALTALALTWSVGSSLSYYPHSLSYFNEIVGGPLGGRWHLLDSNIDWGQDLLYLKGWLDEHPAAQPLGLAYYGRFDPRAAGIEFRLPPRGPAPRDTEIGREGRKAETPTSDESLGPSPGWYAVSVMMLHGYEYPIPDGHGGKFYTDQAYFSYFQRFNPVARAGYSIYIYHLEPREVDRVRRELGLPPLSEDSPS